MKLYNTADNYVNFLTRTIRLHRRKVKELTQKIPADGTQGRVVLLEKKYFWNNIGRCRFEVLNAGNPELWEPCKIELKIKKNIVLVYKFHHFFCNDFFKYFCKYWK